MREIRFRAWSHTEGKYIKGGVLTQDGKLRRLTNNPIRYTLEQYTGLKDKNGVEIYEGDVVSLKRYHANKRWWSTVEDIPKIEREVKEQIDNKITGHHEIIFKDGCFEVRHTSQKLCDFLQYDLDAKALLCKNYHESGSGRQCDYKSGYEDLEVIGNIHEDLHLISND